VKDVDRERRALLKRLGLTAAWLPLLGAGRARADTAAPKLICVMAIQGYRQQYWKPAFGPLLQDQPLPQSVAVLEPHKADLIFLSGLNNASASGTAGYGTVFWGLPNVGGGSTPYREPNGPTLDQVVAGAQPNASGSLAFGVQLDLPPVATTAPGGRRCFWRGAGMPVVPEGDPLAAYVSLFGPLPAGGTPPAQLRVQHQSVLDYVGGSLQRFAGRVGSEDRRLIQAHLAAVRALEQQLQTAPKSACGSPPGMIDLNDRTKYPAVLGAQIEVMLAALACGTTRVATLQLADAEGSNINFGAFVPGIPTVGTGYKSPFRNWKDLGHNPVLGGQDHKQIVDAWWMARFADLIAKLKAIPDGPHGRLFDNTVVLWANPVEEGSNHNSAAMPWMIAGSAGGRLRTGQHVAGGGRPSSDVLAALATALGAAGQPFGAPMKEILA